MTLTREEFYERYGNLSVKFASYYKYAFKYVGVAEDGVVVTCYYGGNSSDIYRYNVEADSTETVGGVFGWIQIVVMDGENEIYSEYNW